MYKYSDNNENNDISLHDCRATEMKIENNSFSFTFDNGFYVLEHNKNNPNKKLSYTDRSEVVFHTIYNDIEGNITVYIFSKTDEEDKSIREEITPHQLSEMLNKGIELEFLYSYKGYKSYIFECCLWFETEPYHKECVIIISADNVTFNWNTLYVEKQ